MPLESRPTLPDRWTFHASLSSDEIGGLIADPFLRVLQTDGPVADRTWDELNDRLFSARPEVKLRLVCHLNPCDLRFLKRMNHVRQFAVEVRRASRVESITALRDLESLSIGIDDLESIAFLEDLQSDRLHDLALGYGVSKSRKVGLGVIERFPGIRTLHLERVSDDLAVVHSMKRLEEITLRSITVPSFRFLRGLESLWSVDVKLGGDRAIHELGALTTVKYLELWSIRGLSDLSFLSEMTGLQSVFLQALRNVASLPDLSRLHRLRRLQLLELRGLKDVSSLATAPALEELFHNEIGDADPQFYVSCLPQRTLKSVRAGFARSAQKSKELRELLRAAGIEDYDYSPFVFA